MFSKVDFRFSDAGEERLYSPELIEKAFVDISNVSEEILQPHKYIVHGQKGAGKTALSARLQYNSKVKWNIYVEVDELEEFQYRLLEKIGGDKGAAIGGAFSSWQLLLYLRVFSRISLDEDILKDCVEFSRFISVLKEYGFMSNDSLMKISQKMTKRGVFGQIKRTVFKAGVKQESGIEYVVKNVAESVEAIKHVVPNIRTGEKSYYVILDGLDYTMREGRANAKYLGDLINAARFVNATFYENNVGAKIIILIRDEILSVIPDPNLAKRVSDNGVELIWHDNIRNPFESSLLAVIQKRVSLVMECGSIGELWRNWFPENIHNKRSVTFVLDNTRYLPRDLISFFRLLQKTKTQPPFTPNNVLTALKFYSAWFQKELSDSLVGLLPEDIRLNLPGILAGLGESFSFDLFESAVSKYNLGEYSPSQIIETLYNTSWVGNMIDDRGRTRFSWKHRNYQSIIDLKHTIIIHSGLYKSLNLK